MSAWKILTAGTVALATVWTPAYANPTARILAPVAAEAAGAANVVEARYRGHRHFRHRHRGRNLALGIGVGVLGAIIASEAYRPRAGYYYDDEAYDGPYYAPSGFSGDPRTLCAQNFRSFEWNTGMYTTYGGERKVCPYLR
jgi:hypothetical protein